MPEVVLRECPNCAGVLPPVGQSNQVKCEYCGLSFDVKRTVEQPKAPRPMPMPAPRPMPRPSPGVAPKRGGCTVVVIALVAVLAVAAVGFFTAMRGPAGPGVVSDAVGLSHMETVGFYAVNGDAIEDLVAFVRTVGTGSDDILLVAFDGATMREVWRAGPFGSYGQAFQYTKAAVIGNRALVADFRAQAHLYDLASGATVVTVALPDRAKEVCRAGTASQVELRLQNESRIVLDVATGAHAPPAVMNLGADACMPLPDLSIPQVDERTETPPPGIGPERTGERVQILTQDGTRIAVGRRPAGVRVPVAAGMGPDGRTPVWTAVIPTVDEGRVEESGSDTLLFRRGSGRLYAAYTITGDGGARLAALDARTGGRLWETPFTDWTDSPDLNDMRVGPNRILVEEFIEAAVFDASTGALLARISNR